MATGTIGNRTIAGTATNAGPIDAAHICWLVLRAMGSLKITVAMFALGTLILFVGTLAQDEETIVDVKNAYFNSWVAVVPFDVFVPQTIWPHKELVPYAFAIPGGAAVGMILLINLIAAKLTRFQMNAKGGRFVGGLVLTIIGFVLVGLIVLSAHLGDGLQGEPPFPYDYLWYGVKASVFAMAAGAIAWSIGWTPKTRVVRWTAWTLTAILIGISLFLLLTNDAFRIPNPGLRIVWQLTKSLVVSVVLLIGLLLLFGNRGGNVLIHLGVGLLMLGQFIFGDAQREEHVSIFEGQKTVVAYEQDKVELAFIDTSSPDKNHVIAFDHPMLERSLANGKFLTAKELPFEFRVDRWMVNSVAQPRSKDPQPGDDDFKLDGQAKEWVFREVPKSGGAKSQVNLATAYITLREKETQKELGSYAVSQYRNDARVTNAVFEKATSGDKSWDFGLRFRRNYKPYSLTLEDVVLEQYTGTAKPKDYSSHIVVTDNDGSTLQKGRIWMNNPMRFRGETFYQSGYVSAAESPIGVEQTTLQVVTNAGWLIPYVACVLSGLGMLVHFGATFARFASRYDRQAIMATPTPETLAKTMDRNSKLPKKSTVRSFQASNPGLAARGSVWSIVVPLIVSIVFALWVAKSAMPPKPATDGIDWYAVGQIPTQFGGRIKPLASSSAEMLEILSGKKTALTREGHEYEPVQTTGKSISSTRWIMSVFAKEPWIFDAPLFKIDAIETVSALGLKRHKSHRYSYNEVGDGLMKVRDQFQKLSKIRREDWSFEQEKLVDAVEKFSAFELLLDAYTPRAPKISEDPAQIIAELRQLQPSMDQIRARSPLAIIPPIIATEVKPGEKAPPAKWEAFGPALFESVKQRTIGGEAKTDSVLTFLELVNSLSSQSKNAMAINEQVKKFKSTVQKEFGTEIRTGKVGFEAWYEHFNPIYVANVVYVFAGIVAFMSFAFARTPLRRTAFWLCVIGLVVHTTAIVSRIYISERPPVVTLYSAAVFIGWAMVLFCTITELLFPISVSVLVASTAGFLTLQVAHGLNVGDTMPVLEAVLDTQFWLSTHVISVSLGYSATFIAGFVGIGIIVSSLIVHLAGKTSQLGASVSNALPTLYRICYGVVCFGLFFSFVGTVLGGLWGDDSWGRFWGWDPKENGAMMIVLWNALLLHAKWDKMIAANGFAILAVVGNIITAWSMFGTNLLGVGLHAYGFSKATFNYLVYFVISQLLIMGLGVIVVMLTRKNKQAELE